MGTFQDLTGQKFGRLTVLEYKGNSKWLCKCDCGNIRIVRAYDMKIAKTISCGCYNKEHSKNLHTIHNCAKTKIYNTWCNMKSRCYNKNNERYKIYGARGITVCQEWLDDFINFYNWAMANGYSDELSIDRIDVNGNYEPSNCRWANIELQSNNKRSNRFYTFNNETLTLKQWSIKLHINYFTLQKRLSVHKWDVERAFTTPPNLLLSHHKK